MPGQHGGDKHVTDQSQQLRFDYSPIVARKPFRLPEEARVAVWVVVNIEYFDFAMPVPTYGSPARVPDLFNWCVRDYGNRVGIWRVMEVLDRHAVRATAALNAAICERCPLIVEEARRRRWGIAAHGITNSVHLNGMSEAEERAYIAGALDGIARATGERPRGWLSSGMSENFRTPDILAEEGVRYVGDWCNDDQPYLMRVRRGSLISVPYSLETNDITVFLNRNGSGRQFVETVKDQFDTFYREGASQPRVMAIALHHFVMGVAHRIAALDEALRYIRDHEDVWFATGDEIADWYSETCPVQPPQGSA